jgi:hypothetical protein
MFWPIVGLVVFWLSCSGLVLDIHGDRAVPRPMSVLILMTVFSPLVVVAVAVGTIVVGAFALIVVTPICELVDAVQARKRRA